jgi:hypothetical protein
MKLREACELGRDMGCWTIEEAVLNVEIHAMSLFNIDNFLDEMKELHDEYADLPPWMINIEDLLER